MLSDWILIVIAGGIGSLARFGLSGLAQRIGNGSLPIGTLAVNALGCLLFGLVWSLSEERLLLAGHTRFIILTGFMGAFTTFSTFAFETTQLLRDAEYLLAAGNIIVQNVVGIALVVVGIALGKLA